MASKVVLLMQSAVNGGVQRVMINLAQGLVNKGVAVDFIICDATGEMLGSIPKECKIIDMKKRNYHGDMKVVFSITEILKYIKKNRKAVYIGAPGLSGSILSLIRFFDKELKIIAIVDNKVSLLKDGSFYHTLVYYFNKIFLKYASFIVAAHNAAAKDIYNSFRIRKDKIKVVYHPLIDLNNIENAEPFFEHKFANDKKPIIIAVGRLVPEKDFENLIKAFAIVKKKIDSNLIILGDGPLRAKLENYVINYNLCDSVDLYGYTDKVFSFIKIASIFVLSSKQEAFGNVLVEALACGVPIVTTDCESGGPREIIDNQNCNRYGDICKCEDSEKLANSILTVLNREYKKNILKQRAELFTIEYAVDRYISLIRILWS